MRRWLALALASGVLLAGLVLAGNGLAQEGDSIAVGSKSFTEGVVLGELIRALAASSGARVEHRQALGGTRVVFNARVKIDGDQKVVVAADFLREKIGVDARATTRAGRLLRNTGQHVTLVGLSLCAAILVAVPLGIAAARMPRLAQVILGVVGIAQTIPALALLVFMIPVFGIGPGPALVALFLYSLLPIVRNTYSGLIAIPLSLRESAEALGLPAGARLRLIEAPLAAPSNLAGIKTAAVINVGAATLGALIGAGGYGQPILTGIRLDDVGLILEGAVPAAGLAIGVQWLFDWAEHAVVPRGLRASTGT